MIIIATLLFVFLIFPILFNVKLFFSLDLKKLYFSINIYNLSILSGYIEQIKEGFAIHLSKNTAIIIPYKKILGIRASAKPLKDYHFINLNIDIDLGNENNMLTATSTAFLINYICRHYEFYLKNNKPHVNLNKSINIYEHTNALNVAIKIQVLINLLIISISLIKIGVNKILNAIRNKTRQNNQSC